MSSTQPQPQSGPLLAPRQSDADGPLAEFAALRGEIQEKMRAQEQIMALQLTVTATVFGFALSRPGLVALLLIVPFSSYLLSGRLVSQHFWTQLAAEYITTELSPRAPGGLHWEAWLRAHHHRAHLFGSALPRQLAFVGASALGLIWTAGYRGLAARRCCDRTINNAVAADGRPYWTAVSKEVIHGAEVRFAAHSVIARQRLH